MTPHPSFRLVHALLLTAGVLTASPLVAAEHDAHGGHAEHQHAPATAESELTVTGEVLDMACYLDHGAMGADHADCAQTCIESGLPVGLRTTDGKTYLLIGEHMPANRELAKYAAKTITVRGKFVSRDGINLLENIEIVKP